MLLLSISLKRKKVLVPCLTFSATAAAVLYNDLEPIFVDINKDLTINFKDLKRKYTKDCVALFAVHFAGHPCEMDKIVPWARRKKLIVIEDCAHTCGGTYKNKKLGTWGETLDVLVLRIKKSSYRRWRVYLHSNNKKIRYFKINFISRLSKDPWERHLKRGKNKHWFYEIKNLGYKYNMNNVIASLAIPQLKKLRNLNKRRIYIIQKYIKGFRECKNLQPALNYKLKNSCYWLFILKTKKREN